MSSMKKIIKVFSSLLGLFLCANQVDAQDIQFGDPKQVIQFYNQSIIEEGRATARLNFRDVKVQKLNAFRAGLGVVTMPLTKQSATLKTNKIFATAGGGFNQSHSKLFRQSMGLIGVTLMQQISKSNTYFSVGFQGVFNQNNLNFTSVTFQDQYNAYGPLPGIATADPLAINASYNWLSLNAGVSLSQSSEQLKWFVGGSLRHINTPAVSFSKNSFNNLAVTSGLQMGASFKHQQSWLGVVAYYQSKSEASETLFGCTIDRMLGKDESSSIGGAVYYRFKDAVMPQVALKFGKTRISFLYELPIQTSVRTINQKTGAELTLIKQF